MFDTNKFASQLQSLRISKNLSQQQLADAIGVTKSTISRMESASRAASIENLHVLADFFQVSLDYLVGRIEEENGVKFDTYLQNKDEELLIKNYRMLNDISKGRLVERSRILIEESTRQTDDIRKKNA